MMKINYIPALSMCNVSLFSYQSNFSVIDIPGCCRCRSLVGFAPVYLQSYSRQTSQYNTVQRLTWPPAEHQVISP